MKQLTLILLLITSTFIVGQNFAPIGATWYYETGEAHFFQISYGKWEAVSDTTILGKPCRRIVHSNYNASYVYDTEMYVYEDSGVVYQFIPPANSFTTLYDFTANPGEFWTLDLADSCSINVVVDSVDNIIINGFPRKLLFVTYNSMAWGSIVEGIGNINEPLPDEAYPCDSVVADGTYYRGLRCYEDTIIGFVDSLPDSLFVGIPYLYFSTCDTTVVGVNEINAVNDFSIYPNPTSNHFTIEGINEQFTLSIYNSLGQLVYKENKVSDSSKMIDISSYNKGLFFIKIVVGDEVITRKIIKE